jgi:hypothetical protein
VAFAVPPEAPTLTYGPVGKGKKLGMLLSWVDNSITATGFTIQRASDVDFTQNVLNIDVGLVTTYTDPVGTLAGPFYYRMKAVNTVGSTVVGYPTITAASDWSNWVGPPQGSTTLAVSQQPISKSPVVLSWTYAGLPDSMFGFLIQRDTDPTFPRPAVFETGLVNTFSDGSVKATTLYYYRVAPLSDLGPGYWSNTASITTIK